MFTATDKFLDQLGIDRATIPRCNSEWIKLENVETEAAVAENKTTSAKTQGNASVPIDAAAPVVIKFDKDTGEQLNQQVGRTPMPAPEADRSSDAPYGTRAH